MSKHQLLLVGILFVASLVSLSISWHGKEQTFDGDAIKVKTRVLVDDPDIKVIEIDLAAAKNFRVTIDNGKDDTPGSHNSLSTLHMDSPSPDKPAVGKIVIVNEIVTFPGDKQPVLRYLFRASSANGYAGGPAMIPLDSDAPSQLEKLVLKDGTIFRGDSKELIKIRDRMFMLRIDRWK